MPHGPRDADCAADEHSRVARGEHEHSDTDRNWEQHQTVLEVAQEPDCDWHTVNDAVTTYGKALLKADRKRLNKTTAIGLATSSDTRRSLLKSTSLKSDHADRTITKWSSIPGECELILPPPADFSRDHLTQTGLGVVVPWLMPGSYSGG